MASDDLDLLDHREVDDKEPTREEVIASWVARMSRSRAKGTTLDYAEADQTPISETHALKQDLAPAFEGTASATNLEIPAQPSALDPDTGRDRVALAWSRTRNLTQERASAMRR